MRFLKGALGFCLAAAVAVQTAPAQPPEWQHLRRPRPGEAMRLELKSGGTIEGPIQSWRSDSVSIVTGPGSVRSVSVGDVRQLSIRVTHSRLKAAAIGAGIGFGGGFALGAASAGHLTDQNNPNFGARTQAGAEVGLLGAGIGALIGALAGGSRYRVIYRVRHQ